MDPERLMDVPAGTYEIGIGPEDLLSLETGEGKSGLPLSYLCAASPRTPVELESVRISRRMVTAADFGLFVEATGFVSEAEREGWGWTWDRGWTKRDGLSWRRPFGGKADDAYMAAAACMPALQISWNDAEAWCLWMSDETGLKVRLPSEAEWEVCARMTGVRSLLEVERDEPRTEFDTTDSFFSALEKIFAHNTAPHPTGVLWEWSSDWLKAYPGGGSNPDYGEVYRVLRGGSLAGHPLQRSREYRFRRCPTARSPFYSFRFALG